jgi:hypothetical protein
MAESLTISTAPPPLKSMDYALLREEGLKHIQRLAGKIWTDDNAHDPGITILEMLAYAITDLGYRTNYHIRDILTPEMPEDIRNFFAAKEIMPNYPVTFNDYRKLLIDVELTVPDIPGCGSVGVKNAWIEESTVNEIPFYLDALNNSLSYTQPNPDAKRTVPRCLYNILLEFGSCETLGDLNSNTLENKITINGITGTDADVNGTIVQFEVEFPRWDTPGVNWDNPADIKKYIKAFDLSFSRLPSQYSLETYGVHASGPNTGELWVTMNKNFIVDPALGPIIAGIINDIVCEETSPGVFAGMILTYQQKVKTIFRILEKVKATLMEHRNLGEDFFRYNAIKIDQIALCADVEIANDADVEEVHAQIMYRIAQFLDPTVYFYTLSEMYAKGYTTDQIFEGPLLAHGFIEDKELARNNRPETIHTSDLLSIIMDIPGVLAVRKIQIAGIPLDNDDNIPVETVRWCLEIPISKNYVPRLSVTDSKLLFFKENLPYRANPDEAQLLLDELEVTDRPQKLTNPSQDIPLEAGEYKDIESYFSIQEEFPLVYGTSSAGLPATATAERQAQAKQLKGYLLFFEQLLADFLSQLFHVKDLFSMNDGKGLDGNPIINKTYFSQSLINLVPDALPLYVNPTDHAERLQGMVEDEATYLQRRNRVLSHLMARFAESFADYAMIEYKIDGPKAPAELIEDKLAFLNNYPAISSRRFNAFNYLDPCELWHVDNISGLERRASYLAGVDKLTGDNLWFSPNFKILAAVTPDEYYFEIEDSFATVLLRSVGAVNNGFSSVAAAKLELEKVVINGVNLGRFRFYDGNNTFIPDISNPPAGLTPPYRYEIACDDGVLGQSIAAYGTLGFAIIDAQSLQQTLSDEFYNNPESNRYNLECFMDKYIVTPAGPVIDPPTPVPPCPQKYIWNYTLNNGEIPSTDLLFGEVERLHNEALPGTPTEQAFENKEEMLMEMLRLASDISNYRYGINNLMQEVFTVVDRCGDAIGTSSEEDFNFPIQQQLIQIMGAAAPFNEIRVVDSDGNNGTYTMSANVVMDTVNTQLLKIQVNEPITSGIVGGFIRYAIDATMPPSFIPTILDANKAEDYFEVDKELHRILAPGQVITVDGGPNAGEYTVERVVASGMNSLVYVKEEIPSTLTGGILTYTKLLPIYKLSQFNDPSTNAFYVKPGMDEVAAQELADWIKAKFFSHEGMHIVEHILLRPKYNEAGPALPIAAGNNNELQNVTPAGNAVYLKQFTLANLNQAGRYFEFGPGDYTADFSALQKIRIVNSALNNNTYTVRFATVSGLNTRVTVYENIPSAVVPGDLQYSKTAAILQVTGGVNIRITDPLFVMPPLEEFYIKGSADEVNDGKFHASGAVPQPGGEQIITFDTKVAMVTDDFLPVDLDNGCRICRYEDPYSHIVSVILPAWQGRFSNQYFRAFFDKLIRMECPAHIVLNICWINCKQMGEFELHFKQWLQEQSLTSINKLNVSNALNRVIDDVNHLRSVYPEGILHDCDSDPQGENAIVLNQTILGTL